MKPRGFMRYTDFISTEPARPETKKSDSFHLEALSNLQQGVGRLNFFFEEQCRRSLQAGFDKILRDAFDDQSKDIKFRRKSNFEIIEIPDKPMTHQDKQKKSFPEGTKPTIPKLDIETIRYRSSSESKIYQDSNYSVVKGKDIMTKLQKIYKLVKETKQKYKNQEQQARNSSQYSYHQQRHMEDSFYRSRHLHRKQSQNNRNPSNQPILYYSNSKLTCSYAAKPRVEQSQYIIVKKEQKHQQKRQKKNKLTQGEKQLLNEFKEIKGYFKELIGYSKEVFESLNRDRQRTLRTETSEVPSYLPLDSTYYNPNRVYTQPSQSYQSYNPVYDRGPRPFTHNRTKTQIPAHHCGSHGCCYENTLR